MKEELKEREKWRKRKLERGNREIRGEIWTALKTSNTHFVLAAMRCGKKYIGEEWNIEKAEERVCERERKER